MTLWQPLTRNLLRLLVCIAKMTCLAAVLGVIAPASAQNLLTNPSVEGLASFPLPPNSCHGPDNSQLYYRYNCIPEIEPPSWWLPFWNDGAMPAPQTTNYRRPEFRLYGWPDLGDGSGPHFTYDGQWYLVFFGFFGAIDAGIYQQVTVEPGSRYEFSYQGYVWSNCLDGKNPGSGLGCDNFPADQGVLKAGIDPTGGTDYTSPNIIWSDGDSIYDAYDKVSVDATATSSTMTVFVRCTFLLNYQHNDAHVDGFQLIKLGPTLELDPSQLNPTIHLNAASPVNDTFTVTNGGVDVMNYAISEDAAWLGVSPTAGSSTGESDTITVTYDATGLPVGQYTASITVTSSEASNSPQVVPVVLTVESVKPDADGDGDVDLEDFGLFQACFSGGGNAPLPLCVRYDFDSDNDVDAPDLSIFLNCASGANVPADPACDG